MLQAGCPGGQEVLELVVVVVVYMLQAECPGGQEILEIVVVVSVVVNPQRTGVFYKRKGRGGGPLWPPRLSRLIVMGRG